MATEAPGRVRRARRALLALAAAALVLSAAACAFVPGGIADRALQGRAFKHYRRPLTVALNATPAPCPGSKPLRSCTIRINEPFTRANASAEWNSTAIGELGKSHGLKKVYFADVEITSILGIYNRTTIYLYGE